MKKRMLALLLALTMVVSLLPVSVFAAEEDPKDILASLGKEDVETINYVALGDSMTNGYGQPGYYPRLQKHYSHIAEGQETASGCLPCAYGGLYVPRNELWGGNVFGYLVNAPEAYPSLLASKLEKATNKNVSLLNMAISGMRAEELHVLLDLSYKGDGYTGKIFTNDNSYIPGEGTEPRFQWATAEGDGYGMSPAEAQALRAEVQAQFGGDYSSLRGGITNDGDGTAKVRAEYQVALKNADLISIALGTNNFGTGVQTSIYRALQTSYGVTLGDTTNHKYDLEGLLKQKPELKPVYEEVSAMIYETIETEMPKVLEIFRMESIEDIVETYSYGLIGFMVHYEESLKLIRKLNPEATIVVVGAMNMEDGIHFIVDGEDIDFGELYGTIVDVGNLWLAKHVAGMDNVYYSETEDLNLMVDEIAEGKFNSNTLSWMGGDLAENILKGVDPDNAWNVPNQSRWVSSLLNKYGYDVNKMPEPIKSKLQAVYDNPGDADILQAFKDALVAEGADGTNRDIAGLSQVDYFAIAIQMVPALIEAAKDPYIDLDKVINLFAGDGFQIIFTQPQLLMNEDVQDLLYFYARMMFGSGAGVHPSIKGHQDVAADVFNALSTGYTGADAVAKKETEMGEKFAPLVESLLKSKYPNLYAALNSDMGGMDDLAIIITMLKMSDNASLAGVDLDALEADIREALRDFEASKTAEEQAAAKEDVANMMRRLWALATKATGTKYVPTESSYYVSLGDSNVTGFGLDGYINNEQNGAGQVVPGAAPVLLAQELFGENWEDRFGQFAQGALRAEDLLYILGGDFEADAYFETRILSNLLVAGDLEATREAYIAALKKADLISVVAGGGNVTTFVGHQVQLVLAGQEPLPMDWAKVGYDSETLVELDELLDTMVPMMDAFGLLDKYLPEGMTLANCGSAKFGRTLLESLLYGYASYNYYYPQLLAQIREINPDAQLLILGMFNPVDDWTMTTNSGEVINIGGMTANAMDMANLSNLAYALQNDNTSFVDVSDTSTFLDEEMRAGTEAGFDSFYNGVFEDNGVKTHASENGHKYMFNQMLIALSGIGAEAEVNALMEELYGVLTDNYLTTTEKLEFLAKVYNTIKHAGALDEYPEIAAIEEIYSAIDPYMTEEQTLKVIVKVCEALFDGSVNGTEARAIAKFIYFDVLATKAYAQRSAQPEMTAALKLEIIVKVYGVLKEYEVLPASPELDAMEKLYTDLTEEELLTEEQILGIFDMVFETVVENETITDEVIAGVTTEIMETILNDPTIPTENKLAIVQKVTEALGNTDMGGAAVPAIPYLDVIQDLQMNLKNAGYLSDEQATQIINYLYEKLTSGEELNEKALLDIAQYVYTVVFDRAELTIADKLEIVKIIYTTLEAHGIVSEEILADAMIKAIDLAKELIPEYYDEAYEWAYAFAAANGYIVMAQNGIDMAIAAIEDIDLTGTEITVEAQAAIETELAAIVATLEEIKIALGNATTVDALVEAVFALEGDLWAHLNNLEQLALQAGADVYELVYLPLKDLIVKINGAVEAIIAAVKDYVAHIITGEVEMSDEFFYLAITDGNDGYADLVAESLGLTAEQYKKVTMEEVTAADIAAADFITVAYSGVSALEFAVEQLLGEANGYVQYVDEFVYAVDSKLEAGLPILNTVGVDIYGTVMEVVEAEAGEYLALVEGKEVTEMDWAALVGAENVAYVEAALAELRAALIEAGVTETIAIEIDVVEEAAKLIKENVQGILLDTQLMYEILGEHAVFTLEIPVADLAVFAAESAAYEFISYNKEYADTMMAITAINPEATVAALGNYNRFNVDYTFVTEEIRFTLAEILAEVEFEVECECELPELPELPACAEAKLIDAITKYGQQLDALINASVNTEMVIPSFEIEANDALALIADITSAHPFAYAVANYNVYFVNICDAREGGDAYIAMQIMNGLTVNMPCIHVYDDCADEYCNICGEKRVAPGHKFEDGVCTVCGAKDPNYKPEEPIVPPVHVHVAAIIPATEPTCTEPGLTAGTVCATCGMILAPQRVIPALGHTEEVIPAVEATCSATGLTEGKKCSVCGEILVKQEEVAKLEHTFQSVVTEPTCDATGYTTHTCTVCGYSYKDSTTAKRAHKWDAGVIVKEPTCTRPGSMQVSCSYDDCDAFYFDNLVPALGHTEETIPAVAATCTETGLTEGKKCSVCGEILVAQEEIAAKGHSFGEWTVTKEATRKEAGEETRSCACGETETREIPALGGANVGAIVGGGVGGAGVLAVAVYFFLKKKKLF